MTNKEFYKDQITDISCNGIGFGVNKTTGEILPCSHIRCSKCVFINREDPFGCDKNKQKWANQKYKETCPFEKDELVEVSEDGVNWQLRHFSHIDEKGIFAMFINGKTSKETNSKSLWKYCRKYGTLGGLIDEN